MRGVHWRSSNGNGEKVNPKPKRTQGQHQQNQDGTQERGEENVDQEEHRESSAGFGDEAFDRAEHGQAFHDDAPRRREVVRSQDRQDREDCAQDHRADGPHGVRRREEVGRHPPTGGPEDLRSSAARSRTGTGTRDLSRSHGMA